MKCAQPGCTGNISDGYCDVCGLAANSVPAAVSPTAGENAPAVAGASSTRSATGRLGTRALPALAPPVHAPRVDSVVGAIPHAWVPA